MDYTFAETHPTGHFNWVRFLMAVKHTRRKTHSFNHSVYSSVSLNTHAWLCNRHHDSPPELSVFPSYSSVPIQR